MPYPEWGDSFRELYNDTPGTNALEDYEREHVESLFEVGFTIRAEEYDAMGITPDQVSMYREEFFQYMGLDSSDFDWEAWREAMGYD